GLIAVEYLDGDLAMMLEVVRQVNGGHTAATDLALDTIAVVELRHVSGGGRHDGERPPKDAHSISATLVLAVETGSIAQRDLAGWTLLTRCSNRCGPRPTGPFACHARRLAEAAGLGDSRSPVAP